MIRLTAACALLTCVLLLMLPVGVEAYGEYGEWDTPEEGVCLEELEEIIVGLETSVDKAVESNAAHPAFVEDLRNYIEELRQLHALLAEEDKAAAEWGDYPVTADVYDEIPELTTVRGGDVNKLQAGTWEIHSGRPTLAVWEDRSFSSVAIEATVTFLEGGVEFSPGLYDAEDDLLVHGGVGPHGNLAYIGAGTPRSTGREWSKSEGQWRDSISSNQPYHIRVEIRRLAPDTRIDLYIDGEKFLTKQEETRLEEGHVAFRVWTNKVRVEDIRIEDI